MRAFSNSLVKRSFVVKRWQVLESDIKTYGKVLKDLSKQADKIEKMDDKQGKEVLAKQVRPWRHSQLHAAPVRNAYMLTRITLTTDLKVVLYCAAG